MKSKANVIKRYKKVISLALVLSMMIGCFTGMGTIALGSNTDAPIRATSLMDGNFYPVANIASVGTDHGSGWEQTKSQATVSEGATSAPIGNQPSIVIGSPINEGYDRTMPNRTTVDFRINTKAKYSTGSKAVMFYLELPVNPERTNSTLRLQDCVYADYAASQSFAGVGRYDYLSTSATAWVTNNTPDVYNTMSFPSGFKGYVKIYLDGNNGATTKDMWFMNIRFGAYGGETGDLLIGGIWDVTSDSSSTNIIVSEPTDATGNYVETAQKSLLTGEEAPIIATHQGPMYAGEGYSSVALGTENGNGNYYIEGEKHGFTVKAAQTDEPLKNLNDRELLGVKLNSTTVAGSNIGVSAPLMRVAANAKVKAGVNTVMMYIETPKHAAGANWSVGIDSFCVEQEGAEPKQNWISSVNNMAYSYMDISSNKWVYTTTDADEHLLLPDGFKGYIRLDITDIVGLEQWDTFNPEVDSGIAFIDFKYGTVGGEYGAMAIGGIYNITQNSDSIYAQVQDWIFTSYKQGCLSKYPNGENTPAVQVKNLVAEIGSVNITDLEKVNQLETMLAQMTEEELAMLTTDELAQANGVVVEYREKYLPKLDLALWSSDRTDKVMNATSVAVNTETNASKVAVTTNPDYMALESQAAVQVGDSTGGISNRKQIIINSAAEEGWVNEVNPGFDVDFNWVTIDPEAQDLMFYVKLPATGNGSGLRIRSIGTQDQNENYIFPNPLGMKYKYLEADGQTWIKGTIGTFNELTLPDGFEGYIRLQLDTAANYDKFKDVELKPFVMTFSIGSFGGEAGAAIFGGAWYVSKEDRILASADGGEATWMSTCKEQQKGMGIAANATADFSYAKMDGYTVSEYGTLMISEKDYSGEGTFTEETTGVQKISQTDVGEKTFGMTWQSVYEKSSAMGYGEKMYFRTYVEYTNGSDTIRLWNAEPYKATSIQEIAGESALPLIYGDMNTDSKVDDTDYAQVRKYLLGTFRPVNAEALDVNLDGYEDVADMVRFKKFIAGEPVMVGVKLEEEYFLAEQVSDNSDLTITTFNVGRFNWGTGLLDEDIWQNYVAEGVSQEDGIAKMQNKFQTWKTLIPNMDSDIYGFQEWETVIYRTLAPENAETYSKDVFGEYFNLYGEDYLWSTWLTTNGKDNPVTSRNPIAINKNSEYTLTDVTYGYLGADDEDVRRGYVKGYITVEGKKIAIYNVHLEPRDAKKAERDASITELANLMKQEEYAIAMGDMNCTNIAEIMMGLGMKAANMGDFGNFATTVNSSTSYIDNIITTSNIDIKYVESDRNARGESDHYPITAYLKVK